MISEFLSEKKKKKSKHSEKSEKTSPTPESAAADSLYQDVPSPPPQPIFKESAKNSSSSNQTATTTAKQHNVKERSAGVEAGVIKPKPRGSNPKLNAAAPNNNKKPASTAAAVDASMSAHKRSVMDCCLLQVVSASIIKLYCIL